MEWVVTRGRTLEEALESALDELGIDASDAEYEVLEEPRGGLLGRLRGGEYRLRVRVRPISREKPQRRRRPGPRRSDGLRPQRGTRGGGPDTEPMRGAPAAERMAPGPRPAGRNGGEAAPGGQKRGGPRESGAGRVMEAAPVAAPEAEGESMPGQTGEEDLAAQADLACRFLRGLLEAMHVDATVRAEVHDDSVDIDIEGECVGPLIGQRAVTLYAIEDLTRAAVLHSFGGHVGRLTVDVGGYRAKRRAALEEFAQQQVERVRRSGRAVVLEPMNAADRKVVHDVVLGNDGVTSSSEGEEPRRSVVIRPA